MPACNCVYGAQDPRCCVNRSVTERCERCGVPFVTATMCGTCWQQTLNEAYPPLDAEAADYWKLFGSTDPED